MTATAFPPRARSSWLVDAAKFEAPVPRRGIVRRDRLIARLAAADDARIVTVIGPAGSGKTTLVGQLANARGSAVAWVTADDTDNEPKQLLRDITAALDDIVEIDPAVVVSLSSPDSAALRVLPRLTNSLRGEACQVVLVLDDCHLVTDQDALDVVALLVERMPRGSMVVLAGRRAPELPLARWHAEGGLAAVTADDLALSLAEARRVCAEVGTTLSEADLEAVVEATEGWAAGVYLALVSLSRHGRRRPLPRLGDDTVISAYIEGEILAGLPGDDVEFMTLTSILRALTGSLCDAVSGIPGSAERLASLEARNLLVVPVDQGRRWFRYHSLLRAALRHRLERVDPTRVAALHLAASTWLEEHGDTWRAIDHALQAGAIDTAARLIGVNFLGVYRRGGEGTIARWLAMIGEDVVAADPVLPLVAAWRSVMVGEPDTADHWTPIVEARAAASPGDTTLVRMTALLRATQCRDGIEAMRADADLALELEPPLGPWGPVAMVIAGLARVLAGETDAAQELFRRVEDIDTGRETNAIHMAWAEQAMYAIDHRAWSEADELVRHHRTSTRSAGVEEYQTSLLGLVAEARLAIRSGDARRARDLLARAQLVRPRLTRAMPHWAVRCLVELARTQLMAADPAGAAACVTQAEGILAARPGLGILDDQVATLRSHLAAREHSTAGSGSLTPAELRILPLLQTHLSVKEMAGRLGISPNTAKTQSLSLYSKLSVRSRSEAVDRAVELGLLEPLLPPLAPNR